MKRSQSVFNPVFTVCALASLACGAVAAELGERVAQAARYESGVSAEPLRELERRVREAAGDPARRADSENALLRLLVPEATYEAKRFACVQLAVIGGEASLPALSGLLKSGETVGMACFALSRIRSPKAGEALRAALPAAQGVARLQLVETLGHRGEAASVGVLAGLAREADAALARAAVRALGAIDDQAAREAVAALRREASADTRDEAAAASLCGAEQLASAGERSAAAALAESLLAEAVPAHVRRGAFGVLLRSDADGGLARIKAALSAADPDPVVAGTAIAHIPLVRGAGVSKTVEPLFASLPAGLQVLLLEALEGRGDGDARELIRAQVEAKDAGVRRAALMAVARSDGGRAVPLLAKALAQAAPGEERKELQLALAGLAGGSKTDEALCAVLNEASEKDKPALMEALSRRGGASAVPALLDIACGKNKDLARSAAQALTRLAEGGDAATLSALQSVVSRDEAGTREAALRALAVWPNPAAWEVLLGVCGKAGEAVSRGLAFRGLVRIAGAGNVRPDEDGVRRYRQLLEVARDDAERKSVINTLAGMASPSALALALPLLDMPGVRPEAVQAVERIAAAIRTRDPEAARAALSKINAAAK